MQQTRYSNLTKRQTLKAWMYFFLIVGFCIAPWAIIYAIVKLF